MNVDELLPAGVYPIWSPYDSYEAANILMQALAADLTEALTDIKPCQLDE